MLVFSLVVKSVSKVKIKKLFWQKRYSINHNRCDLWWDGATNNTSMNRWRATETPFTDLPMIEAQKANWLLRRIGSTAYPPSN
jgi:hypothetical protein